MDITVFDFLLACSLNFLWFSIVFTINFDVLNDCRKYTNKSYLKYDCLNAISWFIVFIWIVCGIISFFGLINYIGSQKFVKNNILLIGLIAFICILVIIFMRVYIKHNVWFKNEQRFNNIQEKLEMVEKLIEKYQELLKNYNISVQLRETYSNFVTVLKDIREELKLILVSVDIAKTVQTVKDIDLESHTLNNLEKEVDKIKAYHSLDEISSNISSLMKKYDTKK